MTDESEIGYITITMMHIASISLRQLADFGARVGGCPNYGTSLTPAPLRQSWRAVGSEKIG